MTTCTECSSDRCNIGKNGRAYCLECGHAWMVGSAVFVPRRPGKGSLKERV